MERPRVDARELSEQIQADVRASEQLDRKRFPDFKRLERLQHLEELAHVNKHWVFETPYEPQAAGLLGALKKRVRRRFAQEVLAVLKEYLLEERTYLSNLVQLQNEIVKRCELLTQENRQLSQAMQVEADLLTEKAQLLHNLLEQRVAKLEANATED